MVQSRSNLFRQLGLNNTSLYLHSKPQEEYILRSTVFTRPYWQLYGGVELVVPCMIIFSSDSLSVKQTPVIAYFSRYWTRAPEPRLTGCTDIPCVAAERRVKSPSGLWHGRRGEMWAQMFVLVGLLRRGNTAQQTEQQADYIIVRLPFDAPAVAGLRIAHRVRSTTFIVCICWLGAPSS